jgi:asparagine synthase (glutamine-hydrolysing)
MCGIAGIVGSHADRERVTKMSAAIAHRGPDDVGTWFAPGVAFAHRRLAIIDLSPAGHQPMASRDGRYHIVYNGEIYNYREIAAKLPNVPWRSESDTEVLLEAYAAWGPACLDELVGMYAFAIWDSVERRSFCARDRLGIKPLYLARLGDGWAFGSEIGALLAAGVPARANDTTIYDYLARDFYEHSEATFFAGIVKVPAGHWCYLAPNEPLDTNRYWNLADEVEKISLPPTRAQRGERLIDELASAVRLALRSDVPIGITLSGGLDSAVLLSLVDRAETAKLAAFSFDFAEPMYSERPWVDAMAAYTGHAATFRTVAPHDFTSTFESMIAKHQEPHAGLPITAYQLCFETLRGAGVIVAMDGSGIDEALAGYERFKPAHWADLERLSDHEALAHELDGIDAHRAHMQMQAAASDIGELGRGQDLTTSTRPDCIAQSLRDPGVSSFERPFDDALRNLMYRELRYTKLPRALRFRDRLSMAYGTELRPPFLDHRAIAYMFALPAEDRISRGRTKALLRDAAATMLPDAVRLASKRSVQTPQREWFRGPLANWVRERVDQPSFWQRGWIDREPAIAAVNRFLGGEGDNSFFIWQWIALEQWARTFLD